MSSTEIKTESSTSDFVYTPIHSGSVKFFQRLLWYLPLYEQDIDGDTQLHISMVHLPDGEKLTQELIDATWPSSLLDIRNSDGMTAMHLAAMGSHDGMIRSLLVGGANPMCKDNYGNTPLHYASKKNHSGTITALTKALDIKETTKMHLKRILMPNLLECINERNSAGETPLHVAVEYGHYDTVKLLVDMGGNLDLVRYNDGRRPLHIAIAKGHKNIVKYILKYFKNNSNNNLQTEYCCPELMQPLQLMGLDGAFLKIFNIPVKLVYPEKFSEDR